MTTNRPTGVPAVKSLPAYYVLVVAGHGQAVPADRASADDPTLMQRIRALIAGLRPARRVSVAPPRAA